MKRQFVISAMLLNLCVFSSVIFSQAISAAETKPNVVIILTDDQGFGELGVTGNPIVRTPQMDHDNVGKLLAKLDELNLSSNTIVMLFSDNGCQQHPFQTLRSPRMSRT
jgi:arylsulfatase A-like enzyme